jgi:hypothetical protein
MKGELKRSKGERFECQCGKTYKRAQELKRHQEKCDIAADVLEVRSVEQEGTRHTLYAVNGSH